MPKYSVIIPVYNAEKTLHRCLDSLLKQNYASAEIILVNDGSGDSSGEICKKYAAQYEAIVYIEKANGGVSAARNTGLNAASGKYVLFVDSDDYVADGYFQTLDTLCAEFDYDCVIFSQNIVKGASCTPKELSSFESRDLEVCVEKFCEAYYQKVLNPPHNKRYSRRIIEDNKLRFPEELSIAEDKIFCLQYALYCSSCCITQKTLYNVCVDNENSLSRKPRTDLQQQFAIVDAAVQEILRTADIQESHRQRYMAADNLIQLRAVYSEAKRMHQTGKTRKVRRKKICEMCRNWNERKLNLPSGKFSTLLRIPVKLSLVTVIDGMGWYLAR
jgi:glycosyltransferase involved in cell wall biosynthesis